jgi:hypothetical protein
MKKRLRSFFYATRLLKLMLVFEILNDLLFLLFVFQLSYEEFKP